MSHVRQLVFAATGMVLGLTARFASAQEAKLGEDGQCIYVVPSGSVTDSNTGNVYLDGQLLGNEVTACESLSDGGVHSDTCTAAGYECTSNSQCCSGQCNWSYDICAIGGNYGSPSGLVGACQGGSGVSGPQRES